MVVATSTPATPATTSLPSLPSNHVLSETEAAALISSESTLRAGWLHKRGGKTKAWKKRWFVLRRDRFAYYNDQTEYETRKVVQTEDVSAITSKGGSKRADIFFYVNDKEIHLRSDSQEDADQWVAALKLAVKLASDKSVPVSPINIQSRPSHAATNQSPRKPRTPGTAGNVSSSGSPPLLFGNSLTNSLPFSDDENILSDEDFTYPLSEATTIEAPTAGDYIPTRSVNDRADNDKVICQGYLRRHFNSRRRGSANLWAVLRPYGLYLYPDHKEYRPSKIVPISQIIDASDLLSKQTASQPSKKSIKYKFQVVTKDKAMRFSVDEETQLDDWVGALKSRLEMEERKQQQQQQ